MTNSLYILAGRVVCDNKVAVLYSPGFGSGWSSWAFPELAEKLLFDPEVVTWVLNGKVGDYPDLETKYGVRTEDLPTIGGAMDLAIRWVPIGTKFRIHEYDGSESVVLENEDDWILA